MQGETVRCMTLVIPTFRREATVDRQPHKVETPQVVLNPSEACTLTDSGPRTSLSFPVRAIHELIGASAGATHRGQPTISWPCGFGQVVLSLTATSLMHK